MENSEYFRTFDLLCWNEHEVFPTNQDPEAGPAPILEKCMELHYDLERSAIDGPINYLLSVPLLEWRHSIVSGFLGDMILYGTIMNVIKYDSPTEIPLMDYSNIESYVIALCGLMDRHQLDKTRFIFEYILDRACALQVDIAREDKTAMRVSTMLDRPYASFELAWSKFELVTVVVRQTELCLDALGKAYSSLMVKELESQGRVFSNPTCSSST